MLFTALSIDGQEITISYTNVNFLCSFKRIEIWTNPLGSFHSTGYLFGLFRCQTL